MANSETADLMSVGAHCAYPDCRQLDFLPFKCSRCSKVYCLEHRVCGCAAETKQVVVCPLCARAVIISAGEDVELVFDRHTRTECDPSNYDRVHRKARCPAGSCKERLTSTNSYTCRECGLTVCLKHRLPGDHKCGGRAAATANAAAAAGGRLNLTQSLRRMFSSSGSSAPAAAPARQQQQQAPQRRPHPQPAPAAAAAANSSSGGGAGRLRAVGQRAAAAAARTTDNLQAQLQQYRQRQHAQATPAVPAAAAAGSGRGEVIDLTTSPAAVRSPAAAAPAGAGAGAEACPQCGARFATVQQLIQHAETAHANGWSSGTVNMQQPAAGAGRGAAAAAAGGMAGGGGGGGGGGLERCPHCGQQFADPVALVAHVERQHAATAAGGRDSCVLC